MEKICLISDVHANLASLEEVLRAAEDEGCKRIWCLGDTVGYGSEPAECLSRLFAVSEIMLAGNHDLAAIGVVVPDISGHRHLLKEEKDGEQLIAKIRMLESQMGLNAGERRIILVHGSPFNPVWDFMDKEEDWDRVQRVIDNIIVLCGHTHRQAFGKRGPSGESTFIRGPFKVGRGEDLDPNSAYLINPGSVGRSSPNWHRATWAVLILNDDGSPVRVEWRQTKV